MVASSRSRSIAAATAAAPAAAATAASQKAAAASAGLHPGATVAVIRSLIQGGESATSAADFCA